MICAVHDGGRYGFGSEPCEECFGGEWDGVSLISADEEVCWVGLIWWIGSDLGWLHGEALFGVVGHGVVDVVYGAIQTLNNCDL